MRQHNPEIEALFYAGMLHKEIAAALGVHRNTVQRYTTRQGLLRGKGSWKGTIETRFWANVHPEPNTGCWLWSGASNSLGYGMIHVRGQGERQATHVSLEMHRCAVPPGMFACHRCDTPPCVNPDHLFVGSAADNNDDMRRKGRARYHFSRIARAARSAEPLT